MGDVGAVRRRLAWRIGRLWLPRWFRERYEAELIGDHLERCGGRDGVRLWWPLLWDCVWTGAATRLQGDGKAADAQDEKREARVLGAAMSLMIVLRRLARRPAFAVGVVVTLALALGANLTMFSVLDRLLLRAPAGVDDASSVRRVYVHGPTLFEPEPVHSGMISYPEYEAIAGAGGFAATAAYSVSNLTVGHGAGAERVRAALASAAYFPLLGVDAGLGRLLHETDDVFDAAEPVVVLSDAYWARRFGRDRGVLGRELAIGQGRYTVIGVAERRFSGTDLEAVDVWLPLYAAGGIESGRGWSSSVPWRWLNMLVRLAPDAHAAAVTAEATARLGVALQSMPERLRTPAVVFASVIPARGPDGLREADVARLLLALAGLVFLIGCANVLNLMLARGAEQRREHAVERALGAGRGRLVAGRIVETAVLALAAGVLAWLLTRGIAPAVFRLLFPDASPDVVAVNRTLMVGAVLLTAVVLVIGLVPAWRAAAANPMEALRGSRASASTAWLRRALLFVQAAVSVVLLIGAGLFVRSIQQAGAVDVGIDTQAITVEVELQDGTRFGGRLAPHVYAAVERLRAHPDIASAAVTSIVPWGGGWGLDVDVPGPETIDDGLVGPFFISAGPDYFRTVGIPIIAGRALTAADDRTGAEPVVVVNEAMAGLLWPGEDAIGRCLLIGDDADACTRVVGIAADYRTTLTSAEGTPLYYIAPHHPGIGFVGAVALVVRTSGDPVAAVPVVAGLVRSASPEIRFANVLPLSVRLEPQLRAWRVGAAILTAFAVLALIVAAVGLYAVLAFEVAQRRFELAVRSALGASGRDLARAVATRTLAFSLAGIAAGVLIAWNTGRLIESLLFGVRATEPAIHAAAILALAGVTLVAVLLPLRRAAQADPMRALRQE